VSADPSIEPIPLDLALSAPDGSSITLGDVLTERLTVVQLVRYFGCLPCQEWLIELDRSAPDLARQGVAGAAVGGSADYQAVWLREEKGVQLPLLLDPEHRLRDRVGASKPLGWRLGDPRGAVAYSRSLAHGLRPQAITRDTVRSPGVVILDPTGVVRWRHIGNRIGHYPSLDEVRAAVARLD
jgi:peroxiredoxin